MYVDFDIFKQSCFAHNYHEGIYQEQKKWPVLFSNNGVKCEIKKSHYTFGWLLKPEHVQTIREKFIEKGYTEKQGKRSTRKDEKDFINVPFNGGDVMEMFWELVEIIEGIETIVKKKRTHAVKPFSKEVCEQNLFEKIAKRYYNAHHDEDGYALSNHRLALEGDSTDHILVIGKSVNWTPENSYREHVVPCVLVHNEAYEMTKAGASMAEVAQMIKQHLAIVLITNEEAELLDYELGLQTTMPEGWEFGQDVFARLKVAGIQLK
jgi:hypothetical protein